MKPIIADNTHETPEVLERRLRTCAECGYVSKTMREYHPYAFCVLVKAGYDPWEVVDTANDSPRM